MDWIKTTLLPRLKSWATWVSVAGAVWILLSAFGLPEKWGMTEDTFNGSLNAVGALLVAFGILNNPANKEGF